MTDTVPALVIGAGIIGLACANELSKRGHAPLILDKNAHIGFETSSRNSEVIHAGIYYPQGSLKAKTCVEGKQALYAYCQQNNIPHRQCGKLIVASDSSQISNLEDIQQKAAQNGVNDLQPLSKHQTLDMEPSLKAVASLFSPSTGIVDSHALLQTIQAESESLGAQCVLNTEVTRVSKRGDLFTVTIQTKDQEQYQFSTPIVVNAAGLWASHVAKTIEGLLGQHIPETKYARGCYFTTSQRIPFSRLIYPIPEAAGLGVHLTLDMAGHGRFGPDVEWIDDIDYTVNPQRAATFKDAIQTYWPHMDPTKLVPDYAGIRPKICGPTDPSADFLIQGDEGHGIPGLINLFGIESPGLTASLAIAKLVEKQLFQ